MKLKINRVIKNWKHSDKIIFDLNKDFEDNGHGRRFQIQEKNNPFWKKAFREFGLTPKELEPIYKNMVGNHYLDGAAVQEHTDTAPEGFVHTRCNLMIKKPKTGGNPVLDGEELKIEEKDLWLCLASLEKHYSTPIKGGERLIFSFGGLVPIKQIEKIILK